MSYENDPRNIFVNQRNGYSETSQHADKQPQAKPSADDYETKVAEMKRLAAKYEREGEGQLVKDIVNNVIEQKARGQLSNDQLKAFANRIRPLLNGEQRQRLDGLLEQLLKI